MTEPKKEEREYTLEEIEAVLNSLDGLDSLPGIKQQSKEMLPPQLQTLKKEIEEGKVDINNSFNDDGRNLLMDAVFSNDEEKVLFLLELGADPNKQVESSENGTCGYTSLFFTDNPKLLQVLLEHGADPTHRTETGQTVLKDKTGEALELLVEHGADIHNYSASGMSYMTLAGLQGELKSVQSLQHVGLDINDVDANGWSPLMYAVATKQQVGDIPAPVSIVKKKAPSVEFVQQLIEQGASVTPEVLALAQENGDNEMLKVLEKAQEQQSVLEGEKRKGLENELKNQATLSSYITTKALKNLETAKDSKGKMADNTVSEEKKNSQLSQDVLWRYSEGRA